MPDTPAENEDTVLVAAVVKGDKDAFRSLIHKYERLVVSMVFRMITQREDAEDLCQDIFLKVYEKLPTFKFQSKLSTWIGSITFNTCINALKKKKVLLLDDINIFFGKEDIGDEKPIPSIADSSWIPEQQLMDKEKEELLNLLMERLPIIQKSIINLFHF